MSVRLSAASLDLKTPEGERLLSDFTFSISSETTGLVGANGSGKSTLIKVLAGDLGPASGAVTRSGSVLRLEQIDAEASGRLCDSLGVAEAWDRLERIERGLGSAHDFEVADWALPAALEAALERFGLAGIEITRPLSTLSGGQRARAALARAWLARPELLLLDEPTNHLDLDALGGLEAALNTYQGAILAVSHDEAFLEAIGVTDRFSLPA